ncbi:MAG: GIY-YIG nuclease family protein [Clostridia bacterium]|nr:GIY-YIG nuclease family protein [Clostridia bacterium]MBQ9859017.1 GIY-YIG nuclease family protein [Oscillospiraceae bacterium]
MYYVYMITNKNNKVLYTGVTNDLKRRIYEHKNRLVEGFSSKYNLTKLVYYNETSDIKEAIAFEKKIKGWLRAKKDALINEINPEWDDLSKGWYE